GKDQSSAGQRPSDHLLLRGRRVRGLDRSREGPDRRRLPEGPGLHGRLPGVVGRQPAGREGSRKVSAVLNLLRHPRVVLLAQVWIGLVFLAAALGKIGDPATFARQIHYFRLLPAGLENTMAIVLPWIELVAALSLLLRAQPRSGALVTAGLMVLFVGVVAA